MLEDFSQHVLDIAENSINAGATWVDIRITEDRKGGWFLFEVKDNGRGMNQEVLRVVTDPFYTSRTTRRVGLGLPFLKQLAELCDGKLVIESAPGKGTWVRASFRYDHIDLPPLGNIPASLISLLIAYPEVQLIYRHNLNGRNFTFDSFELNNVLGDIREVQNPSIARWLQEYFKESIETLRQH
ncbi:MAG: ATP-binding protein [Aminobacterium sp.]|uniref:DNA mismatch repair protein MutL n=1 Tax=bioreactor metagenome TaxID=1076179 RepID=A0A645FIX4_9ZZZZ|nr:MULTISPECIES: ATP-binding protein [unclassified Aminobacterium]MDD2207129.1 ATP-binding protein [Aminobacterium sp.]MDD3426831.1 ATP-binding protein [Aminobacterium sp.]MDD3707709.1 ATP-binding protein [Aminobacterium sp.]MDD4228998.1 ATP-binding protein [Aminobacterium sp.]MDD4551641.1 ATP-binding protein [Aminobacterium sp.]